MQIQFKDSDPRAGTIAQMDSSRGQQLIEAGAAVLIADSSGTAVQAEPVQPAIAPVIDPVPAPVTAPVRARKRTNAA